jgi:hypothetical protein
LEVREESVLLSFRIQNGRFGCWNFYGRQREGITLLDRYRLGLEIEWRVVGIYRRCLLVQASYGGRLSRGHRRCCPGIWKREVWVA